MVTEIWVNIGSGNGLLLPDIAWWTILYNEFENYTF